MRTARLFAVVVLMTSASAFHSQEPPSLGDIARKLKAEKESTTTTSVTAGTKDSQGTFAFQMGADLNAIADPDAYMVGVKDLLVLEKFTDLEQIAAVARLEKARFPGGGWKLFTFYLTLEKPGGGKTASDTEWEAYLLKLKRWMSVHPDSITAPVALANAYVNYAWKARGTDYANTVTNEGWGIFRERVKTAETILKRASALKNKCPEWYYVMMIVALAEGWTDKQAAALFQNAIAFEPDYYYYYQQRAYSLLPKWNGEEGASARFAQEVADQVGGRRGDSLYWLIAAFLVCNCGNEQPQSGFSWARIRRGYDALIKEYDGSSLRENQMCYIATRFGDAKMADDLFTSIGEKWNAGTWQKKQYFDQARAWAAGNAAHQP
jgi:hypothetical protein